MSERAASLALRDVRRTFVQGDRHLDVRKGGELVANVVKVQTTLVTRRAQQQSRDKLGACGGIDLKPSARDGALADQRKGQGLALSFYLDPKIGQ